MTRTPSMGEVVRVRSRAYVVEGVQPESGAGTLVSLACLDDDAQGQRLDAIWELELDTEIIDAEVWQAIGRRGFDNPRHFSAYLHALRWNCVTATDPRLFQAPFRAGIRIDAYQLDPLAKALLLPRVNLFIADDVGLGKTIEAGLIASELLLRRRVREIVVACPPSMLVQWKDELESRFGLVFEILDRAYIDRVRQERGYGVNPWATFPRFLVSHRLLVDETYLAPLRYWLGSLRPGSLLILDEAHHAAPSSGARYAIDSRITRAIREIADRFEHKLFLSATPHNGHSNSFSALLELLDRNRFTRGVKVLKANLDAVMVRRLKEDVRTLEGGFPQRKVVQVDIDDLPESAPELLLSTLLDEYRQVRQERMSSETRRKQAEAGLLISGLQQRLLSSVEAFARTLAIHRRTMERYWEKQEKVVESNVSASLDLLVDGLEADDDRSQLAEEEIEALEARAIELATEATLGEGSGEAIAREKTLLAKMEEVAEGARRLPDARVRHLIQWIRADLCEGACVPGEGVPTAGAPWKDLRLLIFTEYEDTRRYLVDMLRAAIGGTHAHEHRIEVYHGPTSPQRREEIKRAFNLPPRKNPVRILVATDAAREGLNLQAHCHHLFHFDVPWNPSRLEQRNGRIDRKLQPSPVVYCHYFFYKQREEDRVIRALVRKTDTIRRELGSLAEVLESKLAQAVRGGIKRSEAKNLAEEIEKVDAEKDKRAIAEEEFEAIRERQDALRKRIDVMRNRINDARKWIGFDAEHLRDALSSSLQLLGAEPLAPAATPDGSPPRFAFPNLDTRQGAAPTWTETLDTLRAPPREGPRNFQWRRDAPIRPVTFEAPAGIDETAVQLHLEHRAVQRLLGIFRAQGFTQHDLSRACFGTTEDAIPRVVLLGRLSLYGRGAVRLHEEVLSVTARWNDAASRKSSLTPYGREAEAKTLDLLEQALKPATHRPIAEQVAARLQAGVAKDIQELLPHLETRGKGARADAEAKLAERGRIESQGMLKILQDQKARVAAELGREIAPQLELFNEEEKRQLESNRRYWQRWLEGAERDLVSEPARIRDFYQTASARIEPVGIAYLWPVTG